MKHIGIGLIIITFIAAVIMVIHDRKATYIGDKGARNKRMDALFYMFIGICAFGGLMLVMIYYRVVQHIVWSKRGTGACLLLMFMSLLGVVAGILTMIRLEQEKWGEVKVTTLTDCEIRHVTFRSNYYLVKGTSMEKNKWTFQFNGADRKIIEEFKKQKANALVIQYYAKSGRMRNVNIIA